MKNQCCVPGCGKLMEPLSRLPLDKTYQRQWLKVIGNPSLKTKCHKAVYTNYRICRKHFTDEAFQNSKYNMKRLINLNRILNDTPTLHLPVIMNEKISNMINLDNSKPTSTNHIELLAEKEGDQSNHFNDIPTSPYNSNAHLYTTLLKTGAGPRTYCRKVKVESEVNLGNKEPQKSHAEIEISNRTEAFACSSIKEESIDLKEETELHKIDKEFFFIESEIFGENASMKLPSYDHKTQTVVSKIKKEIIDLETEKELHRIDEENVCIESDMYGENASFKLQSYGHKTQILVNKIENERIDLEIKEESIDLDAETELHKIDEENVCVESDMFVENATLRLQSFDHKTQSIKNKIKKEKVDLEIKEESINLDTETELHKIDEENVCVESDMFGEHISSKLQRFNQKTRTVVKNLIDTILFNAENGMYDTALCIME